MFGALSRPKRTWLWIIVAVVVGVAAYSMIGDIGKLGDRLTGFRWSAFVAALALALANYVLRFVRWAVYLRRQAVRVPAVSSALVFGAGLSLSITPAKLGELVKSYLLNEMHAVPVTRTAPIVVAERVSDLIALLALAVIGVAGYGVDPTLVTIAGSVIALGLLLLAWQRPTRFLVEIFTRPAKLRSVR